MKSSENSTMSTPEVIVGVDPGRHSGWAVLTVDGSTLLEAEALLLGSKYDLKNIQKISEVFDNLARGFNVVKMIIEGQYHGRFRNVVARLSEIRGWWEAAAAFSGISFEVVQPSSWRKGVFGKVPSKDRKQAAVDMVTERFEVSVDDNVSEAVLIGLYGVLTLKK